MLHCSEFASYDRMRAAHAARRFPVVIPMLAEGLLHLTAVRLLWPYLKEADEDHLALLGGAIHKSAREVKQLIARWFPQPDIAASVRKLPERRPQVPPPVADPPALVASGADPRLSSATGPVDALAPSPHVTDSQPSVSQPSIPRTAPRGTVAPLSTARYEFRFTGDEETVSLLKEARELLSHSLPDGDMAAIFKRGLVLVVADARRKRHAASDTPGQARAIAPDSRAIPAHVQRAVWDRDDGQCGFVGRNGRRCEERCHLECHHVKPWMAGGMPSVENIALRCHAHNQYEAKVFFARGA